MQVTERTKYSEFLQFEQYVAPESAQELKRAAERIFKPCHLLTIAEFWGVQAGNYELLGDMSDPTVLQVYWLIRFKEYCKVFLETLEKLKTPQTPEQAQASIGTVEIPPQQNMLVFVREYFGLHSFKDAEQCTLNDYILARKDKYNQAVMQHNYLNAQKAKVKKK